MSVLSSGGTSTDSGVCECKWWSFGDFLSVRNIYEQCSGRRVGLLEHARWWLFHYPQLVLVYRAMNVTVGYCRVSDSGEVSIGLAVGYRARGIGRELLREMTSRIVERGHKEHVWARIAVENRVSQECFAACGWQEGAKAWERVALEGESLWRVI